MTVIVTNRGAVPYPAAMRYLAAVFVLAACASDPAPAADAGADAVAVDTGAEDAGATDAGQLDTGAPDAGAAEDVSPAADADAPAMDAGPADAGQPDAGPVDAGTPDAPEAGVACPMGLGDCDGDPANGCEVNTQTDANNCGGCGRVCPRDGGLFGVCSSGSCR